MKLFRKTPDELPDWRRTWGGLEFSSYEIELRNRVTQNGVTLRVTNSKSKNKNLHFELLTRIRKVKIFTSSY